MTDWHKDCIETSHRRLPKAIHFIMHPNNVKPHPFTATLTLSGTSAFLSHPSPPHEL